MARRFLLAIAGLALVLNAVGIARTLLPAQDGLKFIRIARAFGHKPWPEVVRSSDQHPLYSATIALVEPVVAIIVGDSPDAWRLAAQVVSVLAAMGTVISLYYFSKSLFGEQAALLSTFIYVLLPVPSLVGRDTLSDSLFLLFFINAMRLGEIALRTDSRRAWIGTGLISGIGYLVRPEILIVPTAVVLTGLARFVNTSQLVSMRAHLTKVGGMGVATLVLVGSYALVKGEVSERLSLRTGVSMPASVRAPVTPRVALPAGLDDTRWNFAAKEESGDGLLRNSPGSAGLRLAQQWAEGLGWMMLPFVVLGVIMSRRLDGSHQGRWLVGVYVLLFSVVVVRHATSLGYLSGRHALTLVLATSPWIGAGMWGWARGLPERRGLRPSLAKGFAAVGLGTLLVIGVTAQFKDMHGSRWGHLAAGNWLRENASEDDAVLDTRGWANFIRGSERGYDYWHVKQAMNDSNLKYVVVGTDELKADSERAATLRSMLAFAGTEVSSFPDRPGSLKTAVKVYQFNPNANWEAMR